MPVVRHLVNEIEFRVGKNDMPKALKEMRGLKDAVNRVGKEMDSLDKRKPANSSEFLGRMKAMQQSAISTNHTLGELGKTMNNLGGQAANNGVNQLRKNIRLAGEEAKKTSKEMHAAANPIIGGGGRKGGGGKTMAKMSGFSEVRGALGTAAFSYGAGNFLRSSVYEAYDMEDARARLQKISGQDLSGQKLAEYQQLNDERNLLMSKKYATARKDVYDLQASVAESGFGESVKQPLANAITEQILQASKLFALPVEEAKKSILKLVQQAQITDATVLEEWIARVNLMEQQIPGGGKDILQFMSRSAGSGKLAGLKEDEIVAISALGTALSSSTYMGATAARAIYTKIGQSNFTTRQAEGLKSLGYDVEEVSKGVYKSKRYDKVANETGSFSAILELFKRIRDLANKGEEGSKERNTARRMAMEAVQNFFGQGLKTENATKMAMSMIDNMQDGGKLDISKLEVLLGSLKETIVNENGETVLKRDYVKGLELDRTMESNRMQMQLFVTAWQNFKIAFVEDVLPFFTKILNNTLTPALYAFKKLPNIAKYILVFAVGLAALILPLMIIGSGLITLGTVLGWTGGAIVAAGVGVFGALTWLSEKITNGTDDFSIAARGFWNEFKQIISGVWEGIGGVGSWDEVKKNFEMVKDVLGTFFGWIWDYILEPILGWVNAIYQFFIGKPFENAMLNLFPAINGGKSPDAKQIYNQEQAKKRAENKIALESTEAQNLLQSYNVYNGKGQQNFSPIPANNTNNTNTNNITLNLSLPNNSDPQSTANVVVDALTNALALNR